MKIVFIPLLLLGLLAPTYGAFSSEREEATVTPTLETDPKQAAFSILNTKCNICHRKQNPFRVFSLRNMDKNAKRIYQQVFVLERMPKGNEIQLTEKETQTLKQWLTTQNLF